MIKGLTSVHERLGERQWMEQHFFCQTTGSGCWWFSPPTVHYSVLSWGPFFPQKQNVEGFNGLGGEKNSGKIIVWIQTNEIHFHIWQFLLFTPSTVDSAVGSKCCSWWSIVGSSGNYSRKGKSCSAKYVDGWMYVINFTWIWNCHSPFGIRVIYHQWVVVVVVMVIKK